MSRDDPTAAALGFDRRSNRAKALPSPHVEDEGDHKSVERWMKAWFAPWDRYLKTVGGTDEALELLAKCRR